MKKVQKTRFRMLLVMIMLASLLVISFSALASPAQNRGQGNWWAVKPEPENPSGQYDSILYSEIAPKLREIEVNSNRVKVDVIGQSAGGRNLFLVTLSDPQAMGRLGKYQAIRNTMLRDPEKAQDMIAKFGDFKVPVFINGSIHGDEYPGVDASIRLIETLAYSDDPEVLEILDNVILLVNVVQNPDGRVQGTRHNAAGFDLNRDFITQSQPEVRATVDVLTAWNPMVMLDLHGFVNPMLIEPCTPPHNPNYEYDLYINWAFRQAEAMEAELFAQTGFDALIPYRDWSDGWDDWPPIFAPMYAMYHGAYGHTLETPYRDERGVDAHYAAVWGALNFVVENREEMIHDQLEIFRRGFLDLPQQLIPPDLLEETPYDQYNELTLMDFPAGYAIPKDGPLQQSPYEAARLVDFLLRNDVQVDQVNKAFAIDGVIYPKGTYFVSMNQPKRGLANTILWAGWDISEDPGLTMYDISGWSHPLLWGVTVAEMEEDQTLSRNPINRADPIAGSVEGGRAGAYAYLPSNNAAVLATNQLLARGEAVYRMEEAFVDKGRSFGAGTFIIPGGKGASAIANELANMYGLDVFRLQKIPSEAILMTRQKVAVEGDEGIVYYLNKFDFDYEVVSEADIAAGLDGYDVFVNDWWWWTDFDGTAQAALSAFFDGGGDYVGIGADGVRFAYEGELLDFEYTHKSWFWSYNGVTAMDYDGADPLTADYPAQSHGFVYSPLWFTDWSDDVTVAAEYAEGDFFVSGYWPGWPTSGAAGKPVVVHGQYGDGEISLMGINPTFRAHPEHTFRLVANGIYNGLD